MQVHRRQGAGITEVDMAEAYGRNERTWIARLAEQSYKKSRDQAISRARDRVLDSLNVHKERTVEILESVAAALSEASEELTDEKEFFSNFSRRGS